MRSHSQMYTYTHTHAHIGIQNPNWENVCVYASIMHITWSQEQKNWYKTEEDGNYQHQYTRTAPNVWSYRNCTPRSLCHILAMWIKDLCSGCIGAKSMHFSVRLTVSLYISVCECWLFCRFPFDRSLRSMLYNVHGFSPFSFVVCMWVRFFLNRISITETHF